MQHYSAYIESALGRLGQLLLDVLDLTCWCIPLTCRTEC